jgi:xanthine dehydrogenase accessory factor
MNIDCVPPPVRQHPRGYLPAADGPPDADGLAMADERAPTDLLDIALTLRARREAYVLATVVETAGSTSARPGAKALIARDGAVLAGWVGGGCAEATVRQAALDSLQEDRPRVIDLDLDDEVLGVGMPCGGSMRVYVEPVVPQPMLWVLGHGRVAECLCRFGATLGFRVVVDDTPAPEPARFPARTIALIASRKRSRLILDFLGGEGFAASELARLRAPAGLDLGARTPEEIALSVLGEIVMLRRGGTGLPIRDKAGGHRAEAGQGKAQPGKAQPGKAGATARQPADAQP